MVKQPRMTHALGQENLTEREFQGQIIEMAASLGWVRKYHNLYAVGSDGGYPDLTLAHPRLGVCWIEVKGRRGQVGPGQAEWVEDLQLSGQHAYIAFPRDTYHVETLLRGELPRPDPSRHPLYAKIGDYATFLDDQRRREQQ